MNDEQYFLSGKGINDSLIDIDKGIFVSSVLEMYKNHIINGSSGCRHISKDTVRTIGQAFLKPIYNFKASE